MTELPPMTSEVLESADYPTLQGYAKQQTAAGNKIPANKSADYLRSALMKRAVVKDPKDAEIERLMKELEVAKAAKTSGRPAQSGGGGVDVDVSDDKRPAPRAKLDRAPKLPDELTPDTYKVWSREVNEWIRLFLEEGYAEKHLLVSIMDSFTYAIKTQLYAEIPEGELTVKSVFEILDRDYKGQLILSQREVLLKYRGLARGANERLDHFLIRWKQTRAQALTMRAITPSEADVHDLLEAAGVAPEKIGDILLEIDREKLAGTGALTKALDRLHALRDAYVPEIKEKKRKNKHCGLFVVYCAAEYAPNCKGHPDG